MRKYSLKEPRKFPINEALGRILSEDIVARRNNPPMDNSAMDGYALIAKDVELATPENPIKLDIIEDLAAGYSPEMTIHSGQAVRIMTGAAIPDGADAVIMQEDTERNGNSVQIKDKVELRENIRDAGEDVREGETVIKKGGNLLPAHIGMMAVVGRSSVLVGRRPRVAVLSTGDEILDLDEPLSGPCIYNSNGYMLSAQIKSAGGIPSYLGVARDNEEDLMQKFKYALQCDMVVSSGGVSVGDYDLVKSSLKKMGQEMMFWKVAMKPGKPLAFGRIDNIPIFGLPGNPVSSFVSFEQFARPAIRKMMGANRLSHKTVRAQLTRTVHKKPGRQHFLSAYVEWDNGICKVSPTQQQGSGILKSTVNANGLLIFPLELSEITEGTEVTVQILE